MSESPFYEYDYDLAYDHDEAASTDVRGGCFSLLVIPLVTILIVAGWFRFLNGSTNQGISVSVSINEIPANAQSSTAQLPTPTPLPPAIASFFAPSVQFWENEIIRWANESKIDPNLVATIMQIESCGDPRALSPVGAIGLFQVMPYHFEQTEAPYNPDTNASRGLAYLAASLGTHTDLKLAIAGYNGGINTVSKPESDWPRETIRYAYWGSGIYNDALKLHNHSDRLEEWYQAGGASLCRQAENRLGISP
jgi:hypothetical protein